MNYQNEDELMEQYIDALMQDSNAPVPSGLDEGLAAFTRNLILSQATKNQAQPITSVAAKTPKITVLPTQRRSTPTFTHRSRTSSLTAVAAVLIMVIFAAFLWTALNRKDEAAQPGTTFTPATQNINVTVTINVNTTSEPATCGTEIGEPVPQLLHSLIFDADDSFTKQVALPLLKYLNTVGSADRLAAQLNTLTGERTLNSQVFTLDISGDKISEIVILLPVAINNNRFVGGLFVFSCENGAYVASHSTDVSGFRLAIDEAPLAEVVGSYPQIISIRDMNNDGIPELVYTYLWERRDVDAAIQAFDIYQWDGKQLVNLTATNATPMIRAIRATGEVRNNNRDNLPELVIKSNEALTEDYQLAFERNWQQTWGWDGERFSLLCRRATDAPVYRIQAINDGDDNSMCGFYDEAVASYQKAIFNSALKDRHSDERQLLEAYARYRIILLHVVRNKQTEAQTDYDILQAKFPNDAYTQLAKAFWDSYSSNKSIASACQEAIDFATSQRMMVIEPLMHLLPASHLLGAGSDLSTQPDLICPFK